MKTKRRELAGVLARIFTYIVVMSLFESTHGDDAAQGWRLLAAAMLLGLLLAGIAKEQDFGRLRFAPGTPLPGRKVGYLLPMLVVATANLWHGAVLRYAPLDTVWYVLSMLCIGFIEEILFRGYLLQLLLKRSVKVAILVSTLTFGLGHSVNLLNGAKVVPTLLQLVYALAIGLMLSVFVVKTGHLLPCCFFHGVFNALAAFSNESGLTMRYQITVCIVISLMSVGYAWYLWRNVCVKAKQ
ncbi:MAG: CPBP family intramembrane metalloprotease [Faecalibacterium sp.]|jgi:membrane protease YdiL (CAAX protease family)|nr:CPBP family intramembrane metalloprotease [Faecalibacterium sp.]